MLQKQFLHKQYQTNYGIDNEQKLKANKIGYSQKVEQMSQNRSSMYSSKQSNQRNNIENISKGQPHIQQPSQTYSSYYNQKINMANSISMGESQPSKHSRTQKSKDRMKALQQIKEQQQNIIKLKQKYLSMSNLNSNAKSSSNRLSQNLSKKESNKLISGLSPGINSNSNVKKVLNSNSKQSKQLKTQYSREKTSKITKNIGEPSNSNMQRPVETSNSQTNSRSINNSFNPRFYQNEQSQTQQQSIASPSQQYYASYNNPSTSRGNQIGRHQGNSRFQNRVSNSQNASTINTQNRPSSLSLDKFARKPMLTFYQCEMKKFYKYNDQGYLTDREILLREKIEKAAIQALDKAIIQQEQQSQTSKIQKSKSLGSFPKLNNLMLQAQKQRKRKYELYGKYQISNQQTNSKVKNTFQGSKDRSSYPSELPPSSSLSKKKFTVKYRQDENQNLLLKNDLNDDFYHDREQKKKQSHIQQITQNARSSIINKSRSKKSKSSYPEMSKKDFSQSSESDKKIKAKKTLGEKPISKGLSKIGGITSDYMLSSNKSNKNVQASKSEQQFNKPSFVEEFSESSISSNVNKSEENMPQVVSKNSNKKQNVELKTSKESQINKDLNKKSQMSYKKESTSSKNNKDQQNIDMINSNYKKVQLTQQEIKYGMTSDYGSLKLKTNTSKGINVNQIQTKAVNIKPHRNSGESQQSFSSDNEFSKKPSSNSIKSSHIGLAREPVNSKKLKGSRLSNYGSQSAIEPALSKKSSLKKWVRHGSYQQDEDSKGQINMKKNKDKVQLVQSIQSSKQSLESKENQKNNRFSLQSNCLKLDSAVNIKNKMKKSLQSDSRIQEKSQRQSDKDDRSKSKKRQSEKEQNMSSLNHSEGSLLTQSQHIVPQDLKGSKEEKKSRLYNQRQSFRSKASSRRSKKSSINPNSLTQLASSQEKLKPQKFGNLLHVANSQQSISSQQSKSKSQRQSASSVARSKLSSKKSQYTSEFQQSSANTFNLIQRADQLLDIEDQLHEKRKKLQNQEEMTEDFQDLLAKIQSHIYILREILQIATTAIDIYSEDSAWVFKSCLLSLKKYHFERMKVVDSLRGKKSCFKIAQNELAEQDLKQFLKDPEIQLLANDMEHCNQLTSKMIEDFVESLRSFFGQDFSDNQFSLRTFDDRFDLGVLLQEYRTQIIGLRQKTGSTHEANKDDSANDDVVEEETQELMKKRIFKLMEVGFLLSELAGKRIKEFTQEINIHDDFQEYFSDYWPYFERIVKTFA